MTKEKNEKYISAKEYMNCGKFIHVDEPKDMSVDKALEILLDEKTFVENFGDISDRDCVDALATAVKALKMQVALRKHRGCDIIDCWGKLRLGKRDVTEYIKLADVDDFLIETEDEESGEDQ